MKYIVFLLALSAWAQSFPPSSSGNARAIHGKPICASVMTATDGQVLAWSTSSACWVASSAGAGVGDVTGAASLSTGGLIAIAGATAGSVATDSGLAFNTTTKAVGIFGPIIGGQNSTYQGKLQLRGLTSGVSTLSADADGSGMTLDGRLTVTELVAGTTGANLFTAITAPATPSAGIGAVYVDSTSKNLAVKDDAGVVKHGVQTATCTNQLASAISDAGAVTCTTVTQAMSDAALKRIALGVAVGDPAGSALATGVLGYIVAPKACTIAGWNILVDAGTATVDVWKVATGTAIPAVGNTITASAKPAIASGTALKSTTLTGWTTSVAAYDLIGFNLDAVATAKFINITLFCE